MIIIEGGIENMSRNSVLFNNTLVVGVIVLFIGVGIQPAIADFFKESFKPLYKGKTFYGGNWTWQLRLLFREKEKLYMIYSSGISIHLCDFAILK